MDPLSLLLGVALGGAGSFAWRGLREGVWLRLGEGGPEVQGASVPGLPGVPPEPTRRLVSWVDAGLRGVQDFGYLGEHPLAELAVVRQRLRGTDTRLDRGRAVHELLLEALERLRPAGDEPEEPGRGWWPYLVLRDSYLLGATRREIMLRLYLSEGTYNRVRRRAVRAVTKTIRDLELEARAAAVRRPGALARPRSEPG